MASKKKKKQSYSFTKFSTTKFYTKGDFKKQSKANIEGNRRDKTHSHISLYCILSQGVLCTEKHRRCNQPLQMNRKVIVKFITFMQYNIQIGKRQR